MRDDDDTGGHHLADGDSEVLELHCVQGGLGLAEERVHLSDVLVDFEVDALRYAQLLRLVLQLLHERLVSFVARRADHEEVRVRRQLLEGLCPDPQLRVMLFLGSELGEGHEDVLPLVVERDLLELRRVDGRVASIVSVCGRT